MSALAYKFLGPDRVGRFSGFRWPEAGQWVKAAVDPALCRSGIHACRTEDLPWWLDQELWLIELQGVTQIEEHMDALSDDD